MSASLKEKIYYREVSNGKHLCALCNKAPDYLPGTTLDTNFCELFLRHMYDDGTQLLDHSGNTRKYRAGFATENNGGGYWITKCPYFERADISSEYREYLDSVFWKAKRRKALEKAKFVCELCGSAKNLQVHHISYEHLGYEPLGDLLVVCKRCHEKLHQKDTLKGEPP